MSDPREELRGILRRFLENHDHGSDHLDILTDRLLSQIIDREDGWMILDGKVLKVTGARWQDYTGEGALWEVEVAR